MFGNNKNVWDTWIAEVYGTSSGIIETASDQKPLHLFPNPANNRFSLEFELPSPGTVKISILDGNGKLIKELFSGRGQKGKNNFSFNKENLLPGIYFIILKTDDAIIKNEKLVIAG
jgi:hypothetical protein